MRKLHIIFIIILTCLCVYMVANIAPKGHAVELVHIKEDDASLVPFTKGEKLTYEVRYKNVKTGKSILTFQGEEKLNDKEVYHITFFTRITAVTDNEELYAEKDTFLPLEVHRTIKRFGTFTTRIKEIYDQKEFKVDIEKKSKLRREEFSIKKDSPLHNAILLTYYCRAKKSFSENESFKISLPVVDFEVKFGGIETIETPLGERKAYVFSGSPSGFKFYLSVDDKKIPLKIENPNALGYSLLIKSID